MNTRTKSKPKPASKGTSALTFLRNKPQFWGIPLALLAIFKLITSIFEIGPTILPDEKVYSFFSRHLTMAETSIPDYLFYWVFSSTNLCGPNFYGCGKAINIVFFVGIAIMVFLIVRFALPAWGSWLAAVATLFSPIGVYTSFFMPEIMFFFAALVVIYFMLLLKASSPWWAWALVGVAMGVASLVKPHALFLAVPLVVLAIYLRGTTWLTTTTNVVAAGVGTLVSKFGLSFIFAGSSGLSIFGQSYSDSLSKVGPQFSEDTGVQLQGVDTFGIFFKQLGAHSLANALICLSAITIGYLAFRKAQKNAFVRKLFVLTIAVIITGMVTIAAFTVVASAVHVDHSDRIMVRYYEYLIPLSFALILVSSYSLFKERPKKFAVIDYAVISIPLITATFALATSLAPFELNFYDGTFLYGIITFPVLGWVLIAVTLFSIIGFISGKYRAATAAGFLLVPILAVGTSLVPIPQLEHHKQRDEFDHAVEFVRSQLSTEEQASLTVVSAEHYPLHRFILQLDNPETSVHFSYKGEVVDPASLPEGKDWLLLFGDTQVNKTPCERYPGSGYELLKLCRTQ